MKKPSRLRLPRFSTLVRREIARTATIHTRVSIPDCQKRTVLRFVLVAIAISRISRKSQSTINRRSPRGAELATSRTAEIVRSCCGRMETSSAWSATDRIRFRWKIRPAGVYKIFDGKVLLPDDYFKKNKVVVLPLKYGKGHPVEGHPVSDVADPTDITKVHAKISCLTCHQPHASLHQDLLVNDQQNGTAFCATCHKDLTKTLIVVWGRIP